MKHTNTIRRIQKEYKKLQENQVSHVLARPNNKNIFEWHFVIYGLTDTVFTGVYHGILTLPSEYPFKPPNIQFVTPNGRFKVYEKICLSFTNYHPESWSTAWDIQKMLIALVSFMMTEEATTGMIRSSYSERKQLAQLSILNNLNNPQFVEIFKCDFPKLGIDIKYLEDLDGYKNSLQQQGINLNVQNNFSQLSTNQFLIISILVVILAYLLLKTQNIL